MRMVKQKTIQRKIKSLNLKTQSMNLMILQLNPLLMIKNDLGKKLLLKRILDLLRMTAPKQKLTLSHLKNLLPLTQLPTLLLIGSLLKAFVMTKCLDLLTSI